MQSNTLNAKSKNQKKPKQYFMSYIVVYNLEKNTVEERFRFVGTVRKLSENIDEIAEKYNISERCSTSYVSQLFLKNGGVFELNDVGANGKIKDTFYLSVDSLPVKFVG